MKKVLATLLIISSLCLAYNLGERKGLNFNQNLVRYDIGDRYIKIIGNPKTKEEQCKFEMIIYNDSTECK